MLTRYIIRNAWTNWVDVCKNYSIQDDTIVVTFKNLTGVPMGQIINTRDMANFNEATLKEMAGTDGYQICQGYLANLLP